MGLVDDHQIPVGDLNLGCQILSASQLVDSGDEQVLLEEWVAGSRSLDGAARHQLEVEAELLPEFVLPLLNEAPRSNDQASCNIATQHQLPDQQPGHDRLTGTWVIGEKESQRLLGEETVVDRFDLVRIRLDVRRVDSSERIRKVRPLHPTCLRREPERRPITFEGPTLRRNLRDPTEIV